MPIKFRQSRLLILITLFLAMINLAGFLNAINAPGELRQDLALFFLLEIPSRMIWFLIFAAITLRLAQSKGNTLRYSHRLIGGFIIYSLARLIFFTRAEYDLQRLPFITIATLIVLSVYLLIRRWRRRTHQETH